MNFLEELAAEWYEYQGYFVRRNVLVDRRAKGGHGTELDVVAFHPEKKHLVHLEASMDTYSWAAREENFRRKFEAGQRNVPKLFKGLELPDEIEKIVLHGYASKKNYQYVGGGRIVLIEELLTDILKELRNVKVSNNAVPEDKPLLRMLQFVTDNRTTVLEALNGER